MSRPAPAAERPRPRRRRFPLRPRGPLGWFTLLVLLPVAVVAGYYSLYAAEMYQSEARYLVRGRANANSGASSSGIAAMLGAGAAIRPGMEEAQAVRTFIDSLAAVAALRERVDLVQIWRRPEADLVARLWYEQPEAERLYSHYRRRVTADYDPETGIATVQVLAFRPEDARSITEALIGISEELVNRFSARTSADTLRVAREELEIAERRVLAAREALTSFREREQSLDPTASATAAVATVGTLEGALAQARAELQEKRSFMRPDNPQIQMLNNRIAALAAQIGVERARRTRGEETLTQQLSGYERLTLEREFAERVLTSAISSLEGARADAQRQQVFLMRVVEPNMPEQSTHPKGFFNTLTLLVGLTVIYAIGWLLLAGAREHAS